MKRGYFVRFITTVCACTGMCVSAPVLVPHARIDLVSEQNTLRAGQTSYLGLQFDLEPGWHIYWINAGDSGQPPVARWSAPKGVTVGEFAWPVPQRLQSGPLVDYGYEGSILLMAPVTAGPSATGSARIEAEVRLVVCREVCIPGKATLRISLKVSTEEARPSVSARLFSVTRKKVPRNLPSVCRPSAADEGKNFRLRFSCTILPPGLTFFPLRANEVENAAPQQESRRRNGIELTLQKSDQLIHPLRVLNGVIASSSDSWQFSARVAKSLSNERSDSL
jgi:DsbC/DsbD-like thiol-disulfide interchange protein